MGQWQVLYLSAYDEGYRGTPEDLADIQTNCKYSSLILKKCIAGSAGYMRNAISAYNRGHAELNKYGEYLNKRYVDRAWKVYTNDMAGGYFGE